MPFDVGRVSHLLEQMHRSEDDAGDPIDAGQVLVTDGARGFTWEPVGATGDGAYVTDVQTPHQPGMYLNRDGTWRDPLVFGEGTVSAGSSGTVTDDTKYNAWPTVHRLRAPGQLILAYTKGDSHHADTTGKAVCRIGTEDAESAVTWGSEITIHDDPSLWVTVQAISVISTGRVFATLWRDNPSVSGSGEAGIAYSDDDGATWTDWMDLTNGFTQESYGAGRVIELTDGDLLVTIEGSNSGQAIANRSSHTLRSSDGGETWGGEVTIRNYVTDTRPYYETQLVLLKDDSILAIHRTSGGSPGTHYISTSTDAGLTWGAPVAEFSGYGQPNTILSSTGTLFSVTRQNATADTILFTSIDQGITWDAGTVLATVTAMQYGCPVELLDGRLMVIWGDEVSSSNADIDYRYVTEDVSSVLDSLGGDPATTVESETTLGITPAVGTDTEYARQDHTHGSPSSATVGTAMATAGFVGAILIDDTHSTPLIFGDLLQNDDQDDLLYADVPI